MSSPVVFPSRRKPLATCVATIFALAAPISYATTFVTNCNDSGPGSLRLAVTNAAEADTVDATGLTTGSPGCSTSKITLTTGDIVVNRNDLTINGPGMKNLTVTAKYSNGMTTYQYHNRIFTHNGTGALTINDLSMSKGYVVSSAGAAKGGCIYSKATVSLRHAGVYFCGAHTTSGLALGGGIYTNGTLLVLYSNISGNTVDGGSSGIPVGGGARSRGGFNSKYSSFLANSAQNTAHTLGLAGGVASYGSSTLIANTTIADNNADSDIGGLQVSSSSGTVTLINSTISGNHANAFKGGVSAYAKTFNAYNSTIAFNTAGSGTTMAAAGWYLDGPSGATAKLESTLVANNTYGSPANNSDLGKSANVTISGHNNLVRATNASLPADTIVGQCPLLGPLQFNGGLTETHALFSHSPGIDVGNNTYNDIYDQRGVPYVRVSGPPGSMSPKADIGAYEVNQADIVFNNGFEGCP